jgi:hypothetical protein
MPVVVEALQETEELLELVEPVVAVLVVTLPMFRA